jgi:nucleoside-diphosphate-sugar epimerase
MSRVLAVVPDLMLASRVVEGLGAAGHEVEVIAALPDTIDADVLICDLDVVDAAAVAASPVPALGFHSHVDVDTKRAGEEAGIGLVVPRSKMARELPDLVKRLLSD